MIHKNQQSSRRAFLGRVGGLGAVAALGGADVSALSAAIEAAPAPEWDVSWLERVRKASHRAVFDAANGGLVLDLAARYFDNLRTVYGDRSGDVCAVLNIRTRAIYLGLGDAIWRKYPIAEDYKINDPLTSAPSRRNVDWRISDAATAAGSGSLERLQSLGAIALICDFALGHLATRLAEKSGATRDAVHAELRGGLVAGAVLVPSGIFGATEAQNAGCAFFPA